MRKGFSLLEVIIVVAIATSIIFIVSNTGGNITLLNNLVSQELQSKSDIGQTMQIITTEIRSAANSANGAYPVISASTSTFMFYSDTNGDGVTERVRLFLSSSSIFRGIVYSTGTPAQYPTSSEIVTDIIDNVITPTTSTPLFSYYDSSYTGSQPAMTSTADVSPIRLAQMSFWAKVRQQTNLPQYFSILVDIRNLRSN